MKIFESTVKFLESVGITLKSRPFNLRSSLSAMVFAVTVMLACVFLFREASGFKQYTESIYVSSVAVAAFLTFLSVVWKKENIFQFNECWVKIVITSECLLELIHQFPSN